MDDRHSTPSSLVSLILAYALLVPGAVYGAPKSPPPPPIDAGGDDIFLIPGIRRPECDPAHGQLGVHESHRVAPRLRPGRRPLTYGCADFDNATVYPYSSDTNENHCGSGNRTIYAPSNSPPGTDALWDGRYLNWYFGLDNSVSAEKDILDEIKLAKANVEGCTQAGGAKFFDDKYRRTRFEASKQVLLDLLCVAEPKNVRFGLANFRSAADALSGRQAGDHRRKLRARGRNLDRRLVGQHLEDQALAVADREVVADRLIHRVVLGDLERSRVGIEALDALNLESRTDVLQHQERGIPGGRAGRADEIHAAQQG